MDGDTHGIEDEGQVAEATGGEEGVAQAEGSQVAGAGGGSDYQALLSKQEARIKELEGQVAEAAKTAEAADALRGEIEQIKAQAADERVEFQLRLAGVHNVKAAKALLEDHDGDVSALKVAEPWLFADKPDGNNAPSGATGLPNAGAATDEKRLAKHWREVAGLED